MYNRCKLLKEYLKADFYCKMDTNDADKIQRILKSLKNEIRFKWFSLFI